MSQSSISPRRVLAATSSIVTLLAAVPAPAQTGLEPIAAQRHAAQVVAHLQTRSDEQLKAFYLKCSDAAALGQLASGEIALCSIGYEMLLKRSFGGDFMALLAWSRQHPRCEADCQRVNTRETATAGRGAHLNRSQDSRQLAGADGQDNP